jgi:hypothetical protein
MTSNINWIIITGTIKQGHQIASGQAKDSPYPRGSVEMQLPYFAERGLDLSQFYVGTLNISIKPHTFEFVAPAITYRNVKWIEGFPPEDFSFSKCYISYDDRWYPGYVYYPRPETKTRHFHDNSTIEIITVRIQNIGYGDQVQLKLNGAEFRLKA